MTATPASPDAVRRFFAWSDSLDHLVLRPLSHIRSAWEITWDHQAGQYEPEPDSFAGDLNLLIEELATTRPPARYHDNEDRLAQYVVDRLHWPIFKQGNRWMGADYATILEQGGFDDIDQEELLLAAAGRVHAALKHKQTHLDEMEESHRDMLAAVLTIILYQRS